MNVLSHFGLLRGDNSRNIELPDLHHIKLENEGFSDALVLIVLLFNGKTNQEGRLEMVGCLRAENWQCCAWNALAFYFFDRSVGA